MYPQRIFDIVTVTPEMAAEWLRRNPSNRSLRPARVAQYARDMANGAWTLSNDDICFDSQGNLLNGQHRLSAVVKAGVTVVMGVKRNMPADAMATMDSGIARTAGDAMKIVDGEAHATQTAAASRMALLIDSQRLFQNSDTHQVSHTEIRDWLADNPSMRDSVDFIVHNSRSIKCSKTVLCVAHFLISRTNGKELADLFMGQLATRTNEPVGSAILALDDKLSDIKLRRTAVTKRELLELVIRGWNRYAAGMPVQRLHLAARKGAGFNIPRVAQWSRADAAALAA